MLLVDIDHLKMIVAMRGRSAAEAVVVCTAEAIRQSVHDGDICAHLGEGEFMVFSIDCGTDCAKEMAERILDGLRQEKVALAGVKSTVSIGIASHGADTDFSRMYRDADEALYQARVEGTSCVGVFTPGTPVTTRERSDATPGSPAAPWSNVTA
jgi:diguanylate cyclase (GGDEF)-like protein